MLSNAHAAEVRTVHDRDGSWELLVDGKPFFVKGMDYRPTMVGQSPDDGSARDWAYYDTNFNGLVDGPSDAWVDLNYNNKRDKNEKPIGDFRLMKKMGVNTIRWYVNDFHGQVANKAMLRNLHKKYGIFVAVGNKFGAYTIDSGASWSEGTDYRDPAQRKRLLASVKKMVESHKDEPYVLLWLLGNENNYSFTKTNAGRYTQAYASLLNEAALLIHSLDPKHPVAMVNGDAQFLNYYRKFAPAIDIFGANVYRGETGFGNLWVGVKKNFDRPVLVTEYGGSYADGLNEVRQARYHQWCWHDILKNRAHHKAGNSIGGMAFEWIDEWWKAGEPSWHARKGSAGHQGVGQASWTQEYCGVVSQGNGKHSPLMRQLRKAYFMYEKLWN